MKRIFLSLVGFIMVFGLMPARIHCTALTITPLQTQAPPDTKTFTGTIRKSGETFVLNESSTKSNYLLDEQDKARMYEGKNVKIRGTFDVASNLIRIETIEEIV
jgi:Protein of unknown function (DUF5818)